MAEVRWPMSDVSQLIIGARSAAVMTRRCWRRCTRMKAFATSARTFGRCLSPLRLHRTSDIGHRTSDIEHRISAIGHRHRASTPSTLSSAAPDCAATKSPRSRKSARSTHSVLTAEQHSGKLSKLFGLLASCLKNQRTSNLGHRPSTIGHRTSNIGRRRSSR